MAKTSASYTIMDYTDGVSSSQGLIQISSGQLYDQEKRLSTSWATTALQLTPR